MGGVFIIINLDFVYIVVIKISEFVEDLFCFFMQYRVKIYFLFLWENLVYLLGKDLIGEFDICMNVCMYFFLQSN